MGAWKVTERAHGQEVVVCSFCAADPQFGQWYEWPEMEPQPLGSGSF